MLKSISLILIALLFVSGCGDDGDVVKPVDRGPAGRLYVLNQGDGTVYIYDTKTMNRVDSIESIVEKPHYIEFSPDGNNFYITTLETTGRIAKFDANTNEFIDSVTVRPAVQPSAIAITADSRFGYICNFSTPNLQTTTDKYDLETLEYVSSIQAGALSHDLKITSDGSEVIVSNRFTDNISIIYTDVDSVTFVSADADSVYPLGSNKYGPFGVVIDHKDSLAFIACMDSRQVRYLDIAAREVVDSVDIPVAATGPISGPTLLAVSPDDQTVFLSTRSGNSVVAFDVLSKTILADIPLSTANPFGITITDDGSRVYVACVGQPFDHGRIYVIDGNTLAKIDSLDVGAESFGLIWRPL